MNWSQLKKRIRSLMSENVQGRFDFGITRYGNSTYHSRAWIRIDKKEILNMSTSEFEGIYFDRRGGWPQRPPTVKSIQDDNIFSVGHLSRSLFDYLNMSIDAIVESNNPIIKAFGMLDGRLGKRRLRAIDITDAHDLVKQLYYLRCEAEGVLRVSDAGTLGTCLEKTYPDYGDGKTDEEKRQDALVELVSSKRKYNFKYLLDKLYHDELNKDELQTELGEAIYRGFLGARDRECVYEMLGYLSSKTKLCDDPLYAKGCVALVEDVDDAVSELKQWKPRSHNLKRQFASLARHLWAQYDVPAFMDRAWLEDNRTHQRWFKDIGAGRNIRNSDGLPVPLTKKMAHYFLTAPGDYTIEGAIRWGQVHALDGDKRLADALQETALAEDFRDDEFWLGVIRFFVRNPMLDTVHIGPIIDYIRDQKYENQIVFVRPGVVEDIGPEQPNFTMRGRTVESLLRAVDVWHGRLGRERKGGQFQWDKSGIGDFVFVEGQKESDNMKVWRVRELLSSQELITEGRQMRHCVATYANSCNQGRCSIWTMELETEEGIEKLLTIEVHRAKKEICQIRGKHNRFATDVEKGILRRWANHESLSYARYLM